MAPTTATPCRQCLEAPKCDRGWLMLASYSNTQSQCIGKSTKTQSSCCRIWMLLALYKPVGDSTRCPTALLQGLADSTNRERDCWFGLHGSNCPTLCPLARLPLLMAIHGAAISEGFTTLAAQAGTPTTCCTTHLLWQRYILSPTLSVLCCCCQ
jgi:hypothetical protein